MRTLEKVALFWDVDRQTLDEERHADFIIKLVLNFGDREDARWILARYGAERVAHVVDTARDIDPKSRSFWTAHLLHA